MKLEKLLHVYWLKGFVCGGQIIPFETRLSLLFNEINGLSDTSFKNSIQKLELSVILKSKPFCINLPEYHIHMINIYLARISSVNMSVYDFTQFSMIRSYLIKTYKGRCLARGKPARGQRTWSNANTAFRLTNGVRSYITKFKKTHIKVEEIQKINYKETQRKVRKTPTKFRAKTVKKPATIWL